jgi:hypothetical protein
MNRGGAFAMTAVAIEPEPVPLARDQAGRLMVPGTRISLDVLVADFKQGKTPEAIHDAYATVPLADVYAGSPRLVTPKFLADENIDPDLALALQRRVEGIDIVRVRGGATNRR